MPSVTISHIITHDARFQFKPGEGADAVHNTPQYAYAVAQLHSDQSHIGVGLAFTLGGGDTLVCHTIEALAEPLVGREIEELMAEFGHIFWVMVIPVMTRRWAGFSTVTSSSGKMLAGR